jgi:hypothetical protein
VVDYKYIDTVAASTRIRKGFIAQEVEQVFPEAVDYNREFIPNIFSFVEFVQVEKDLILTAPQPSEIKLGDKVRIFIDGKVKFDLDVVEITPKDKFKVILPEHMNVNSVFVFGHEVHNFRAIDYDRIFTLAISSIQEMHQKINKLEIENAQLFFNNERLSNDIIEVKNQIEKINQRLSTEAFY